MDLSIIIVSWNTRALLERCLTSVFDTVRRPCEVFVVDNASADGSADMVLEKFPQCRRMVNPGNYGFARANNQATRFARGRMVLFLNSDAMLLPGAADGLVNFLDAHPAYGAAACRLLNEDRSLQRSCRRFPTYGTLLAVHTALRFRPIGDRLRSRLLMHDWDHAGDRDVDQPMAACLMVRRDVLEEVGLFDEGCFLLYNDVDLCLKIRRGGYAIAYRSGLETVHKEGASLTKFAGLRDEERRNVTHYIRKQYGPFLAWFFSCVIAGDALWRGAWKESLRILAGAFHV